MTASPLDVAVVAGVGPGLSHAFCRLAADQGAKVAMLARTPDKLAALADYAPNRLIPMACDVSDEASVQAAFARIAAELGVPDCVVFNAAFRQRRRFLEMPAEEFEQGWRTGTLGGFHVAQEALGAMVPRGRGTLLFTGATASVRGGPGFAGFAAQKFGLRALAQSLAREFGPQGIHVAHIVIDGMIRGERFAEMIAERGEYAFLDPQEIARTYLMLHNQERTVWTQELDVRPAVETF